MNFLPSSLCLLRYWHYLVRSVTTNNNISVISAVDYVKWREAAAEDSEEVWTLSDVNMRDRSITRVMMNALPWCHNIMIARAYLAVRGSIEIS